MQRMMPMTIVYKILFLFLALEIFSQRIAVAQTAAQRVRIGYSSSGVNYVDLFLAKEKGYFREEGLEPQLIQMSSNIAITANIAGEVDGQAAIGSAIRAIQRGAPLRVVVVTLRRPLFWLVVRPEYRSVKELKGKVLGITTIGGSQHLRAKGMLAAGGLDGDKDITSIQISDQTMQLQALVSNSVQMTALSPPWVAVAREKFKMNILDSALDRFAGVDSGLAVALKLLQEKPDLVKRILRARAKGNRYYLENEREGSEFLARLYRVDFKTALESYRGSKPAFTSTGIPTDDEIKEHLAGDAQILKLAKAAAPSDIFDFSLQREIVREFGLK
ncbi:MAG TPA: ABC transporter substrate-binding protein [Candidatus Binatia bacterium]|nr:ABC transporter substrate-binding protein [Candidatus Binatia bacterium]